jgi:PKD repeat protein
MPPRWPAAFVVGALLALACGGEHTPVLPTDPGNPTGTLNVTVTSDRSTVEATTTTPVILTITARTQAGAAAPDGTSVTINTNLGGFGVGADGKPVQLVTRELANGTATAQFFAGDVVGTANILAQVGTSVARLNVAIVQPAPMPNAEFAFDVSGLSVLFTDASTGAPTQRRWQFGDGQESGDVSPKHEYQAAGTYTVILTVRNSTGANSKSKFVTVTQGPPLVASFTADVNVRTVLLTDTSTGNPVKWSWEFGDGAVEAAGQRNASHTYASPGTFAVKLTVENAFGVQSTATKFVTLDPAPQANFTVAATGFHAFFTDTSTGDPRSWEWNFGDCDTSPPPSTPCTDLRQNTDHVYDRAGTYDVKLTVFNAVGSSTKNAIVTVPVGAAPVANFTFETSGLRANFTDTSAGAPTSWLWDFGDCGGTAACSSTLQNPQYVYATAGKYNVKLTATNSVGSSSKNAFVTVPATAPPVAAFQWIANGRDIHFTDRSTGAPTSYLWNFGDGTTPTERTQANPIHRYPRAGTFTVVLTVTNIAGQSTASDAVVTAPFAAFTSSKSNLVVTFTDQSGNATMWDWDFGDCGTNPADCRSAVRNPVHEYGAAGTYTVRLTATNASGFTSTASSVTVTSSP